MSKLFELIDKIISSADKLGTLSTAAILAFFCLVFLLYILYNIHQQRVGSTTAWEARFKEAEADAAMAQALEQGFDKISTELREVRYEVREFQKMHVTVNQQGIQVTQGDTHV